MMLVEGGQSSGFGTGLFKFFYDFKFAVQAHGYRGGHELLLVGLMPTI